MCFQDNKIGVDNDKLIRNYNRLDVYMNNKCFLKKGGYCVEVSGYDWKKVICKVVGGNIVEEAKDNNEIGLWGLILICLTSTRVGW